MPEAFKITAARFDPVMWSLEVTASSGETDVLDLTKYDGFGMDSNALKRIEICECGLTISFPDFPVPGAMITFERLSEADQE